METMEYYGGTYPEAPEKEYTKVKVFCSFETIVEVPSDVDPIDYVNQLDDSDLLLNANEIEIEDIR